MTSITLNDKTIRVTDDAMSILEALEKAGVSQNHQCRQGLCGACRCKLRAGGIIYKTQPFAVAKNNEVFICIAKALGDVELLSI